MMVCQLHMHDLYAPLLRNWIFPTAQKARGRNYLALLKKSRENQRLDLDSLRSLRERKLNAVLKHASETVPHYKRTFEEIGIKPEDIQSLDDLANLPLLTKEEILQDPESFISSQPRSRPQSFRTSGSSGMPLFFNQDQDSITAGLACRVRALEAWGINQGERYLKFHGGGLDSRLFPGFSTVFKARFMAPLEDRVMNRRFVSAFGMTPQKLDAYWRTMQRFRPRYIFGYPAAVEVLAGHILERGYDGRELRLKLVVCMGEIVFERQKALFREAFGCPTAEEYGAAEVGVMAYSYPCGEIHCMDDYLILEVVKNSEEDEAGEVVVTHLENWASPLIRYKLYDMAVPCREKSHCPDGIVFSRLGKILGRQFDMIHLPDGEIVHGMYFDAVMRGISGVKRFQVTQLERGGFKFRLVVESEDFLSSVREEIKARMSRRFGIQDVEVIRVPELTPESSGKFRYIRSEFQEK